MPNLANVNLTDALPIISTSWQAPPIPVPYRFEENFASSWEALEQKIRSARPPAVESAEKSGLQRALDSIANTLNLEYDDEPAPPPDLIEEISDLVREAGSRMAGPMLEGSASTFYGEINVTWRNADEIVRLAFFPSRTPILQFGDISRPASYQSTENPTAADLASRLDRLTTEPGS